MLRIVSATTAPPLYPADIQPLLDLFDDCDACKAPENRGLCHSERCRRQVLPQIKSPSWCRDAHRGENENEAEAMTETSRSLEEQTKSDARQRQLDANTKRLAAAAGGAFTINRPKRTRAA
jgi:hypothetical protein